MPGDAVDSSKVVALSPDVMDALDERGRSYVIPEDYFPVENFLAMGEAGFALTERICDEIDRAGTVKTDGPAHSDIPSIARLHFYELKILVDAVSTRAFRIKRILESEKPSNVSFFETGAQRLNDALDFDRESIYSLVLPIVCESLGIPYTSLGTINVGPPNSKSALWKRLIFSLIGREMAGRAKFALSTWRPRFRAKKAVSGQRKVLLLFTTSDLLEVVREGRRSRQFEFINWRPRLRGRFPLAFPGQSDKISPESSRIVSDYAQGMRQLWEDVRVREKLRSHFMFDGLDCWPIVESRIRQFITRSLPRTFGTWQGARSLLKGGRFASVLLSTCPTPRERAVASAARRTSVPVILYQHGGSYGWRPLPMHSYMEGQFADYFMAYGEGAAQHFASTTPPGFHQPQALPVGSCSLDRLAETVDSQEAKRKIYERYSLDPAKKVLIYVVDVFAGNRSYFPDYYPDTWYYEHQKQVIRILADHPEFQFLVKLAAGQANNPLAEFVQRLGVNHIKVMTDGRFAVLLPAADAVIIDYPSTPVDESLVTHKPVFVLIDRRLLIFDEEAMTLLGRRARLANDPPEFLRMVEQFLVDGAPADDVGSEKEFLNRYGNYLGDGQSRQRALDFLQSVTDRHLQTVTNASGLTQES